MMTTKEALELAIKALTFTAESTGIAKEAKECYEAIAEIKLVVSEIGGDND